RGPRGPRRSIPLAASRNASTPTTKNGRDAQRLSFATVTEALTVPDLLALQKDSFDWLVGNDDWKAQVADKRASGRSEASDRSGLEEIFEEISPIEDLGET